MEWKEDCYLIPTRENSLWQTFVRHERVLYPIVLIAFYSTLLLLLLLLLLHILLHCALFFSLSLSLSFSKYSYNLSIFLLV